MKIFLDRGDGHVVLERMAPVWKKMGHHLYKNPKGCDIHLSFIRFGRKTPLPKVLRIDGVYYDLNRDYKEKNRSIKNAHFAADAVIYQSETAKLMSKKYLGQRKHGAIRTIIYNGIAEGWCGKFIEHESFNIVISAKWRRHKRLKETIEVFFACLDRMLGAKLHILGKLHDNEQVRHPNIEYYGMIGREKMKKIFTVADLSIHLSKKDACPNSVVEAIGAGVPVITTNACGGSTEMCLITEGCIICDGEKISYKPCKPYKDEYNVLSKGLKRSLIRSILQIYEDRRRVRLPKKLAISHMAEQYINIMKRLL